MAQQRRWLTHPNSKLGKVDLPSVLRQEAAWELLSAEARHELYSLLPEPRAGEPAHNIDVHPLQTAYRQHIEEEVRRWQHDLTEGRESKRWREDAMRAGQERRAGKWDAWAEQQRENEWGARDEQTRRKGEAQGDGDDEETRPAGG